MTIFKATDIMFVITDRDGRFICCCGDRPTAERMVRDQADLGITKTLVFREKGNTELVQRPLSLEGV